MTKRILVCDDYPDIRSAVARSLRIAGFDAVEAADGKAGLDAVLSDPTICCVVSDNDMPRMTGLAFCSELRKKGNNIPFILLSGNVLALTGASDYGVSASFMKPAGSQSLLDAIDRLVP